MLTLLLCLAAAAAALDVSSHPARGGEPGKGKGICCNACRKSIDKANTRLVFTDPPQVQSAAANEFAAISEVNSVENPDVVPYFIGFPFPDPTGLQLTLMMQQTVASFAELGIKSVSTSSPLPLSPVSSPLSPSLRTRPS